MRKRSAASIIVLTILTLGFYHLFWLLKTRNELAASGYKLPSAAMLLIIKAVQITSFLVIAYAVLFAIPGHHMAPAPSKQCIVDYLQSQDTVRVGGQPTVSRACKDTFEANEASIENDHTEQWLLLVVALLVLNGVLLRVSLKRWFVPYAVAAAAATGNRLNATQVMALLGFMPVPFNMIIIQKAFNER